MMAETPEERKARLEALRLELSSVPDGENGGGEAEAASVTEDPQEAELEFGEPGPVIRFRNYVPRDESLQELKVAPPEALKFDDPVARAPADDNGAEEPFLSIAPKKANWDLRRDVAKKLEKLERRTQRAIIQLMQEEEKRRQAASEAETEA
ncbi:unnamed protein product [Calypogeia fissa]